MKKVLFEYPVSRTHSYALKRIEKGQMIPLVSDVMFHTMFNNENRK